MGGSPSSSSQKTTIRYAPYVETAHKEFLTIMAAKRDAAINDSPFSGYVDVDVDVAFFGVGYTLSMFPALHDTFGKFMAGLDIDVLYTQMFADTTDSAIVRTNVMAERDLLDDDIESNILPRFETGMRDINSVMSTSFVTGRAMIEDARVKSISKFSADLKYRLIPVAVERWKAHLDWNKIVVSTYAEIIKFYFSAKMDIDEVNYSMLAKDKLWPFTILEYNRAALGALQGATNTKTAVGGASTASKAISGALSGAASGAMMGSAIPGVGTLLGAGIGAIMGGAAGGMS